MDRPSILIIAGEPSGDLHAAGVARELLQQRPDVHLFGIGGEKLLALGQEQLYDTRRMAIIGFTEVVRHLPFLRRVFRHLEQEIIRRKPVCALLVDYPGFNLRLAKILKKHNIPILYYIAPQVWAWGKKRIPQMAQLLDHLAVVFEFEVELFRRAGLPTTFVGHPLLDVLQPGMSREDFFQQNALNAENPLLGLLPGSRAQEVERLLPEMLATLKHLRRAAPGLQAVVAAASNLDLGLYQRFLREAGLGPAEVKLVQRATWAVMAHSDACLVSSGTATLETGCFGTPLVVVYRVSALTYAIGKRLVKLDRIGLVNIVAGEMVAPEFIQHDFTAEKVAPVLLPLLTDAEKNRAARQKLAKVRDRLGKPGAAGKVAQLVLELAWPKKSSKTE